jgi:hypothetical protein
LAGIAVARLQITVPEFYQMTPVEFSWAIKTKNEAENNKYDFNRRLIFEASRLIIKHIWNSAGKTLKKGFMFKEGKEIERFSWDVDEEVKPQSAEHLKNFFLRLGRRYNAQKAKTGGQ